VRIENLPEVCVIVSEAQSLGQQPHGYGAVAWPPAMA